MATSKRLNLAFERTLIFNGSIKRRHQSLLNLIHPDDLDRAVAELQKSS